MVIFYQDVCNLGFTCVNICGVIETAIKNNIGALGFVIGENGAGKTVTMLDSGRPGTQATCLKC